jgi:GNAT superfamily N-acetyltransferase
VRGFLTKVTGRSRAQITRLIGQWQNALPRVSLNHPIGIVLSARLAVDSTQQGKGLPKALLFDALARVEEAAYIVAVRGVMFTLSTTKRGDSINTSNSNRSSGAFQLLLLKDLRKALRSG